MKHTVQIEFPRQGWFDAGRIGGAGRGGGHGGWGVEVR